MKRLVLGGAAAAAVAAVVVLDPPVVQTLLVLLAVAVAAIPRLARPLRRLVDALVRQAAETPSRLRALDRGERAVVLAATAASGLMVVSVLAPWNLNEDSRGSGFDLPHSAASAGWIVLLAGLAGIALVVLTAPSSLGGACALVAGMVGAAAAFDARDAVMDGCGYRMMGLGQFYCAPPNLGWGLELAIVASLALCSIGAAWLVVAGVRTLQGRATGHSAVGG